MTKKDVLELKKRFKKSECTFTRMCGCYVDADKNIILNIEETFLNLEEEEFYKYLDIAKKVLSGNLGNNLLELEFPLDEELNGTRHKSFLALRESKLKNPDLLNSFYQSVIETYSYTGNYLILLFHDAYDVMTKTSDNRKLDESEEVYEYLLCAICPVTLSKPGLGYREDEHRIGARIRDWIVEVPENGFVFPAFTDRSTDLHSIMYYTKNPKDSHPEFMEAGLGCASKQTATEQKEAFHGIVNSCLTENEEQNDHIFMEIQDTLNSFVEEKKEQEEKDTEPVLLTPEKITTVLTESKVPEQISTQIEKSYLDTFGDTPVAVEHLLDNKALAANALRKKEQELMDQIVHLQKIVEETAQKEKEEKEAFDVIVKVKPEKAEQITTQVIEGKKCLIIPIEEYEHTNVNGVVTDF